MREFVHAKSFVPTRVSVRTIHVHVFQDARVCMCTQSNARAARVCTHQVNVVGLDFFEIILSHEVNHLTLKTHAPGRKPVGLHAEHQRQCLLRNIDINFRTSIFCSKSETHAHARTSTHYHAHAHTHANTRMYTHQKHLYGVVGVAIKAHKQILWAVGAELASRLEQESIVVKQFVTVILQLAFKERQVRFTFCHHRRLIVHLTLHGGTVSLDHI